MTGSGKFPSNIRIGSATDITYIKFCSCGRIEQELPHPKSDGHIVQLHLLRPSIHSYQNGITQRGYRQISTKLLSILGDIICGNPWPGIMFLIMRLRGGAP